MTGLVAITAEPLTDRLAGPAIRALELCRAVSAVVPARLVSLAGCDRQDPDVPLSAATGDELRTLVASADSVLLQGDVFGLEPWLLGTDIPIIVDAYDPFHLEQLEQARPLGEVARRTVVRDCVTALNRQLARADFVLAASARQRDLWLGHLAALGRINPVSYDDAPALDRLLAVVPFGLPAAAPSPSGRRPIRDLPGIGSDAVVALWSGGLYDWFHPELVVRALAIARRSDERLQLVLMGTAHPVLGRRSRAEVDVVTTAERLGLLGRAVHLAPGWIPYDERADWLTDADVGVVAHRPGIEAEFAFRTRLLDHLWAALPTVGTAGDLLTDAIVAAGGGRSAGPGDADEFATRLLEFTDRYAREQASAATATLAAGFRWPVVAAPVVEFCQHPWRAPDLILDPADRVLLGLRDGELPHRSGLARLVAATREGGPRLLATRLLSRALRR
jgi:glycosyltransferase involved in cell wall biosynthesis